MVTNFKVIFTAKEKKASSLNSKQGGGQAQAANEGIFAEFL